MKLFRLLFAAILLVGCDSDEKPLKENHFRLQGSVDNMENGYLYFIDPLNEEERLDTIIVENGRFTLEKPLDGPRRVYIRTSTDPYNQNIKFLFLEPTEMTISLDTANLAQAKVAGSRTQEDAERLEHIKDSIGALFQKERNALDRVSERYRAAVASGAGKAEIEAIKEESNDKRTALQPYFDAMINATIDFVQDNPRSYASLVQLRFLLNSLSYEEANAIFSSFPEDLQRSALGRELRPEIEELKLGIPGALAGDFNTTDINGDPIKLDDFRGQYLLIDFWASWCVPCRKGNPHLLELYEEYHPKGLEILGVSDDDSNPDAWRKAVKKDGIGVWKHVLRGMEVDRSNGGFRVIDDGVSKGYNISSLPTKILVNPEGVVVGRYGGGGGTDEDLERDLERYLDQG